MHKSHTRFRAVVIFFVMSLSIGCGDDDREHSASDAGMPTAGDDGGSSPLTDAGSSGNGDLLQFVPDIPMVYDGTLSDPGIRINAWTIVPPEFDGTAGTYLVSVTNTSATARLCAVDLTTRFDGVDADTIAISQGLIDVPPHRGVSGTGSLTSCLSPGQTGMQEALLELGRGRSVEDIVAARWTTRAINLIDAVPTSDINVTNVRVTPTATGRYRFTGQLNNDSSESVRFPSVAVFGVNSVGRPIAHGSDIESRTISPGSSWSFETLTFESGVFSDIVAYPDASDNL